MAHCLKYDLPPEKLSTLTSMIGMAETGGNWGYILKGHMKELIDEGYACAKVTRGNSASFYTFYLTPLGIELLSQWPVEELLERTRGDKLNDFLKQNQLAYIVRRLPLELLPEFLTHRLTRINNAAKLRLEELKNGN